MVSGTVFTYHGVQDGAAKAKKGKDVLAPTTSHNVVANRSIEDIYQKKSQLEHILLRPDTYIGSTEKQVQKLWVHDGEQMVFKEISFVPGKRSFSVHFVAIPTYSGSH